jgi:hypothetical protein
MVLLRPLAFALLLLLLAASVPAGAEARSNLEYQVKAAFLFNFAKFVEWPADAFDGPQDPVAICVLGKDPFGESLDSVVRGETVNGRRLVVRRPRNPVETRDCQIVFLARSERAYQDEVLSFVEGAILTVGEDDGFLTEGGIISFVLEQNRVRFEVNLAAAEAHRLKLSSKLLRLARSVYPAQAPQARPGS